MNLVNKFNSFSTVTKGAVIGAIAALPIAASVMAFSPADRPTFSVDVPARYVTFNSYTDNPVEGDERSFLKVNGQKTVAVTEGQEITVRAYVHNNAGSNLNNAPAFDGIGVAKNVAFKATIADANVDTLSKSISASISAQNANPQVVSDDVTLTSATAFKLDLVPGSASIVNKAGTFALNDSIASSGVALGYNAMNGNLPGCFNYSGVVTFKVKVRKNEITPVAAFTINKTVSADGTNFVESVNANPGSEVTYNIEVKTTGNSPVTGLVVKDVLPAGQSYVRNSTTVDGVSVADTILSTGVVLGDKAANSTINVRFKAKNEDRCGVVNYLNNVAVMSSNSGSKEDTASVTVRKDCTPTPPVVTPPAVTPPTVKTPTVTVIPNTGAGDMMGAFIGTTTVAYAAYAAVASRKKN